MAAAVLQGVPSTTLDTGFWVDLPTRQYPRLHALCRRLGATVLARTAVALADDTMVNFLFRVDGLREFETELKRAAWLRWQGLRVPVLPLASILKSKRYVGRPKDLAHLPLLRTAIRLQEKSRHR